MITIFCNFYQFAAEKIGVMIKRAQKFAVIWAKPEFFGRKYFNNHNIGPWWSTVYFRSFPTSACNHLKKENRVTWQRKSFPAKTCNSNWSFTRKRKSFPAKTCDANRSFTRKRKRFPAKTCDANWGFAGQGIPSMTL
jgi:hypothetical protein